MIGSGKQCAERIVHRIGCAGHERWTNPSICRFGALQYLLVFLIGVVNLVSVPLEAQTIMVTTSADETDIPSNATIEDLPGPDGVVSFREALLVSDNIAGRQTVGFQIPVEDWYLPGLFPGLCLLQGDFNWSAFDSVIVDGTTQSDFTGNTNPSGNELVLYGLTLVINGDESLVFGLDSSHVTLLGANNCTIRDNTGGMHIEAVTGSENLIRDNEADTIELSYSNFNTVISNTTTRVRISGGGGLGPATGNRIGGPKLAERNYITGWGNYGEHGEPEGTTLDLFGTSDTIIENNYIGTTPDGMAIGNQASTVGIGIFTNNDEVTIRNNLIATHAVHARGGGDYGAPIYIDGYEGANSIHIYGNTLGLNAVGEPILGGLHGIWINSNAREFSTDVRIGGLKRGYGNVIAGHVSTGILLEGDAGVPSNSGIRISGNSIYDNGEIGIDLMPNTWDFGHTDNDLLDADDGANGLQNYPAIAAATSDGHSVHVNGQLHSEPLKDYTLEFFASPDCDPTGFGQGQVFLGYSNVITDFEGNASFDVKLDFAVSDGWVITSTATQEPVGATSEFSECVPVHVLWSSCCPDRANRQSPFPQATNKFPFNN